ncbi:unnamed protein product [Brassicogethes aeneus]|uniref:Uncharacterized protein n=1 Tax=Brassicogethes aeneus TaxID=1431903 RepID=A0A9P0FKK6_BRAAE|nr:unnamed protein product [Brassicogethes aeneus]
MAENTKYVGLVKFAIAISQSVIYLILVIVLCFLATLLNVKKPPDDTFISKYEKYIFDAIGIYMILPFVLSLVLILGILQKNVTLIKIWFKIFIGVLSLLILVMLGSGIFIIIKGTLYVGCGLIGTAIVTAGLAAYYCYVSFAIIEEVNLINSRYSNEYNDSNNNSLDGRSDSNSNSC